MQWLLYSSNLPGPHEHDPGFTIEIKGAGIIGFIVLDYPHRVGTKADDMAKKPFAFKSRVKMNVGLTKRAGLNICDMHLTDLLKECTEGGGNLIEIFLVDCGFKLDNGEILIELTIAPR